MPHSRRLEYLPFSRGGNRRAALNRADLNSAEIRRDATGTLKASKKAWLFQPWLNGEQSPIPTKTSPSPSCGNCRPGESRHDQRLRATLAALYEDMGVI